MKLRSRFLLEIGIKYTYNVVYKHVYHILGFLYKISYKYKFNTQNTRVTSAYLNQNYEVKQSGLLTPL